jgi:hypothetical protein
MRIVPLDPFLADLFIPKNNRVLLFLTDPASGLLRDLPLGGPGHLEDMTELSGDRQCLFVDLNLFHSPQPCIEDVLEVLCLLLSGAIVQLLAVDLVPAPQHHSMDPDSESLYHFL